MSATDTWACEYCLEPFDDTDDFDGHQCEEMMSAERLLNAALQPALDRWYAEARASLVDVYYPLREPQAYLAPAWAYWYGELKGRLL